MLARFAENLNQQVARALGRLGYPGFAYLRSGASVNPMEVLLGALLADDVDARVVEGLPWLLLRYPDVDWDRLVTYAKQHDAQNRLGFLVALASRLAAAKGDTTVTELLERREQALQRSLLQQDDTFSRASLTQAERRWLTANRSPEARSLFTGKMQGFITIRAACTSRPDAVNLGNTLGWLASSLRS